jgi:hypothetical protein
MNLLEYHNRLVDTTEIILPIMNALPPTPLNCPPHPTNLVVLPYCHLAVQFRNSVDEFPNNQAPFIVIVSETFALRTIAYLLQCLVMYWH